MAKDNALDRLNNSANMDDEPYTLEEQLESAMENEAEENDDFLDSMSAKSRESFAEALSNNSGIISVTDESDASIAIDLSEDTTEFVDNSSNMMAAFNKEPDSADETVFSDTIPENNQVEQPRSISEPVNQPQPKKRGRKKKVMENVNTQETTTNTQVVDDLFIPVMNQLAKDLIDQLKKDGYKIARFDDKNMKILYDYMYTKF